MRYVALLRGINVGGNKVISMSTLSKIFQAAGFTNVKTVLASGNVLFDTTTTDRRKIVALSRAQLEEELGYSIGVIVRSLDEIQKLLNLNPFKSVKVTPNTRLYVTFLSDSRTDSFSEVKKTSTADFRFVSATDAEVFFVATGAAGKGTAKAMNILDRSYGANITTRNWNTIAKLLNSYSRFTTLVPATTSPTRVRSFEKMIMITPRIFKAGNPSTSLSRFLIRDLDRPGILPSTAVTLIPTNRLPSVAPRMASSRTK